MTSLPRFSVNNPVPVNLFMAAIIAGGILAALTLVRDLFPEVQLNIIQVATPYPGASPAEIEKGITRKIEERIKNVEGVYKLTSSITEGASVISVELRSGFDDVDQAVNDIKAAIDSIPREDFPEDALETRVSEVKFLFPVITASLYGELDERTLKSLGERLRDDILSLPGLANVELIGVRRDEIAIEVQPSTLVEYGLSLLDISEIVSASNLDLPAGKLRTDETIVAVRTLGERNRVEDLNEILIRSDATGKSVRLGAMATVVDGFEELEAEVRFNGLPCVVVSVSKTPKQDTVAIVERVRALVAGKMGRPLEVSWIDNLLGRVPGGSELREIYETGRSHPYPPGIHVELQNDLGQVITSRLDLLIRNGLWGLALVFTSLLLFLHWRVALWVMMGLVLAIAGSLICMKLMGQTFNMVSMFGLIVVLGLLVDDAIIVGEHVYSKVEEGIEPRLAAISGTEEVMWPVVCAVLTTVVAFAPLMFLDGPLGDIMSVLPLVVCVALTVSLLEALTILPTHLAQSLRPLSRSHEKPRVRSDRGRPGSDPNSHRRSGSLRGFSRRFRAFEGGFLMPTIRAYYERLLRLASKYRYVTVASFVACMFPILGVLWGGHLPFVLKQKMDADSFAVILEMETGAPIEQTREALRTVERSMSDVQEIKSFQTFIGVQAGAGGAGISTASHLGRLVVELAPSEERARSSDAIVDQLRERTTHVSGVQELRYVAMDGAPGGAPIHLDITGENLSDLAAAASEIRERLAEFDGVFDTVDNFEPGRAEVQIELLDSARALGLTTQSLATQVRAAFYGYETKKFQRGREDVKIMVRYPLQYRKRISDIESMRIATPSGALVPFREVGRLTERTGYSLINRTDQRRTVTVKADVNDSVTNASLVIAQLSRQFPEMRSRYPGIDFAIGGQKLETARTFGSLAYSALIAMGLIYTILAALFRSYVQPAIVVAVVPFGIIGAVIGHLLMGCPLTPLSVIGLVALTGILVNDAMILVVSINRRVSAGVSPHEAVIEGGLGRLRPILLTSVTTVLGIAPILLENSSQAKFLMPLGLTISAGLVFATLLTLVTVPAFYLIVVDMKRISSAFVAFLLGRPTTSPLVC